MAVDIDNTISAQSQVKTQDAPLNPVQILNPLLNNAYNLTPTSPIVPIMFTLDNPNVLPGMEPNLAVVNGQNVYIIPFQTHPYGTRDDDFNKGQFRFKDIPRDGMAGRIYFRIPIFGPYMNRINFYFYINSQREFSSGTK